MKSFLSLLVIVFIVGPQLASARGGVDVGNTASANIPQTYAMIDYPATGWSRATADNTLSLANDSGSVIAARKAEIGDLSSPNAVSLKQYLSTRYPERDYQIIHVNGLEGVRADLISSGAHHRSDIYLVSELQDFIHIESDLSKSGSGITEGEKILGTIRVKYQGVAYAHEQARTVVLSAYSLKTDEKRKAAFSLSGNCYSYVDSNCQGVAILFDRSSISVGAAGYDHGRIVELGPQASVPFEDIRVEGEYLVAPASKIPISDIYTAFQPKQPLPEQDSLQLKEGYVYLIRTVSWPEEDIIAKVRVDRLAEDQSLKLTYEKLVYVEPKELQKQVDAINQYTLTYEKPLSKGRLRFMTCPLGTTTFMRPSILSFPPAAICTSPVTIGIFSLDRAILTSPILDTHSVKLLICRIRTFLQSASRMRPIPMVFSVVR